MTDTTARPNPIGHWPLLILPLWFAAILTLGLSDLFVEPNLPVPLRVVPAVLLPPLLFWLAFQRLPAVRDWVDELDLATVVGMQAWRVLGTSFLILWALSVLPAPFAVVGGLGDIAVGLVALPAALAVARQRPGWQAGVRRVTFAGLTDFAVVFALAVLSGPGLPLASEVPVSAMQRLPLVLIPAFGVPAFIILHLIALLKLRRQD